MKTLAKAMVGFVFKAKAPARDPLAIYDHEILSITENLLQERRDRCANLPAAPPRAGARIAAEPAKSTPPAPPPPPSASHTGSPAAEHDETSDNMTNSSENREPIEAQSTEVERDIGVSDDVWAQLQADKDIANSEAAITDSVIHEAEDAFSDAGNFQNQQHQALERLEEVEAQDETEAQDLDRKREQLRLQEQVARSLREKAKAELEKIRLQKVRQKREKEAQHRLQQMGVCVQGYRWTKQSSGYRCAGGYHFVSDAQLM